MNRKIITRICEIFEEELLCKPEDFSVENYNRFEEKIWGIKEEFDLKDSSFLFFAGTSRRGGLSDDECFW